MVFTAIAVVAFTGVSMANTKEVKPVAKKIKTTKIVVKKATPCQELMMDTYTFIMDNIRGGGDDWALLNRLMSKCD